MCQSQLNIRQYIITCSCTLNLQLKSFNPCVWAYISETTTITIIILVVVVVVCVLVIIIIIGWFARRKSEKNKAPTEDVMLTAVQDHGNYC